MSVEEKMGKAAAEQLTGETWSGIPVKEVYTPGDTEDIDYYRDLANPGEYPFARGIHRDMYRGKVWTKQFFTGFGRPRDTNKRIKFCIERGETGIIPTPDLPSQKGVDPDHPLADGLVGWDGAPLNSLKDWEEMFDGVPIEAVHVSIRETTLTSIVAFAQFVACAENWWAVRELNPGPRGERRPFVQWTNASVSNASPWKARLEPVDYRGFAPGTASPVTSSYRFQPGKKKQRDERLVMEGEARDCD